MNFNSVIWDLGGVLIDWNPSYLFDKMFKDEEKKNYFFSHICTSDWNEEQDAGRPIKEATSLLLDKYPDWKEYIEAYYSRWEEMLGGPIPGTVEILKELREKRTCKLYALTNWSAELFPVALDRYEFLHWFDGRVVSGEEKMRKPFPQFYNLLLKRFNIIPDEALFIDDNLRNVKAAREIGITSIRFESPQQLQSELKRLNIL